MAGDIKKDLRTEARSFSESLSNVFLIKKRDPQTKHLLEKAQQLINALLTEAPPRPAQATPSSRTARNATGMGQLWVKLDELKRENDDLKRQRSRPGTSGDDRAASPKSPKSPKPQAKHADPTSTELHKVKHENDTLKQQLEKLQKTLREHEKIHTNMQDDCKRSKAALEAAQKLTKKAREEMKKMESNMAAKRAEKESSKQKSSQQSSPPPPPKPAVSSPKPKKRADNRHTENISERCRPSNIALAYTTLESQQWMDAKEALEETCDDEDEITKFLCDIMMTSYRSTRELLQCVEAVIAGVLENPTTAVQPSEGSQSSTMLKLSDEMSDIVTQKLRASFDKINQQELVKIIQKDINSSSSSSLLSQLSEPNVERYIKECGSVSWQMAVQKPPMLLAVNHTKFDDMKHKLWWSCDQSKAKKINYFIWPVLYDYEGGNLMVKGCIHAS